MAPKKLTTIHDIIVELTAQCGSMRAFARDINEHVSDIASWKNGDRVPTIRAIVTICRKYGYQPWHLNPRDFPEDLEVTFKK
jgi:hypothetical protein